MLHRLYAPATGANHVIVWERPKIECRKNNQRLRRHRSNLDQSVSTQHEFGLLEGAYNLSNIYRPLFTTTNQSNGKQSKSRYDTRSRSQSYDDSQSDRNFHSKWKCCFGIMWSSILMSLFSESLQHCIGIRFILLICWFIWLLSIG